MRKRFVSGNQYIYIYKRVDRSVGRKKFYFGRVQWEMSIVLRQIKLLPHKKFLSMGKIFRVSRVTGNKPFFIFIFWPYEQGLRWRSQITRKIITW